MKNICTIILNRNLPEPTNKLVEHIKKYDGNYTDIFVLEAGSDIKKVSKYCTWHADEPEVINNGLRYCRGMNYALLNLFKEKNWDKYEAFFLLTNDTEFHEKETIKPLISILKKHKHIGILSPCSQKWGEKKLLLKEKTKYFWFIHNNALLLRREFIESIREINSPDYMNFLFDGSNFRGYLSESELIAKAYANDWSAAITSLVFAEENESYLLEQSALIKTEGFEDNLKLYLKEGQDWIRRKYGFNSRWSMNQYVKLFYDNFFDLHPELNSFKL